MIAAIHANTVSLPADALAKVRDMTDLVYHPLRRGYTHSYGIERWPNLRLMEGVAAPPQSYRVAGYRLMLMLHNPDNNYIFRDVSCKSDLAPQQRGTLIALDIDVEYEVHSQDPNGGHGPWSALVWGPQGKPCLKKDYELSEVTQIAQKEFKEFLETL